MTPSTSSSPTKPRRKVSAASLARRPGSVTVIPAPPRDHAALALQYAQDVISKKVPAGPWVRKAAQRHLNDLQRPVSADFPYRFDPARGARPAQFIELFHHVKGRWAQKGERIVLQPWQCFLVVVLFGWVWATGEKAGKRRFRCAYMEIPRKNGKSLLAAGIGLYMLLADGEFGAEVYSGATTEKQAWEVFGPARLMLKKNEALCERAGAEVWAKSLMVEAKNSKFTPIIGNPGDGSSPSCAIVDEYHEHDTPNLHDTMETGMGSREQPLMLIITTAGYNIAGPCHEKHDELRKVLDGSLQNDSLFGCIFGIDEKDDWADPKVLIKANPNYGVSVDAEFLLSQQRGAMANPIQQTKFKTKHLNVWCSVLAGWMNMQMWNLAADPMLDEEELSGSDCVFAIDLASKSDLCSEQRLYWKVQPGNTKPHFYLFGSYWLPEAAIEEDGPNKAHYGKWVRMGLLTPTEGATVDFDLITETVLADAKKRTPREVVYDPYNATQMAQVLVTEKMQTVEFTQNAPNFALPMDEIVAALKDGRFHHDGNEMTTWCISNVVARPAKKGLFSPSKSKPHQKIDGAIAAIMAMARAVAIGEPEYELLFM